MWGGGYFRRFRVHVEWFYFITPSLLLGIRLKSAHEIERTGMTNVWNWTNVDDWPRGIEIGCFFGLFTTRIRRFSSPFLKIAFLSSYTSKNRHFSGSIFGRSGRVAYWPKCEKMVVRFELKTLIKPSIYQILKWSNKPFKVHFSIWFQSALFNLIFAFFRNPKTADPTDPTWPVRQKRSRNR